MIPDANAWLFQQVALLIGSVTVLLAALAVLGAAAGRAFDEDRSVIPPARWDQARQRKRMTSTHRSPTRQLNDRQD